MSKFDASDSSESQETAIVKAYENDSKLEETPSNLKVDVFGFISESAFQLSRSQIEKDLAKQTKWLKILKNWDQIYPSNKVRKMVFSGIPNSVRDAVWKKVLEVNRDIESSKNIYPHMKTIAKATCKDIRQIDLDINRTYRNHQMFFHRYGLKQKSLFYVLCSYACYNKEVGYCQGMASVAALLLMYMDEEDAFWALSLLLTGKRHSMHGLFTSGFPKLLRFQIHHNNILKRLLPKLYEHLESQGISSSFYTLKWYMQCFLDRLPFQLVLRLWDVFILEGDKVLHPIGYTLLKMYKKKIIKMTMDEIGMFLTNGMCGETFDCDSFMEMVLISVEELKKLGLYPVPSVVEGELPNSISSLNFADDMRNNEISVARQAHMITSKIENRISQTKDGANKEQKSGTFRRHYNKYNNLADTVPSPPNYTAPNPSDIRNLIFLSKKQPENEFKKPRSKSITSKKLSQFKHNQSVIFKNNVSKPLKNRKSASNNATVITESEQITASNEDNDKSEKKTDDDNLKNSVSTIESFNNLSLGAPYTDENIPTIFKDSSETKKKEEEDASIKGAKCADNTTPKLSFVSDQNSSKTCVFSEIEKDEEEYHALNNSVKTPEQNFRSDTNPSLVFDSNHSNFDEEVKLNNRKTLTNCISSHYESQSEVADYTHLNIRDLTKQPKPKTNPRNVRDTYDYNNNAIQTVKSANTKTFHNMSSSSLD